MINFEEAISRISKVLNDTGTIISTYDYDGVIIKKLEPSNTLDEGRTTHQTHIAITGEQMDIFPYLYSNGYFLRDENNLKKYFVLQVPVRLFESNLYYLSHGLDNSVSLKRYIFSTKTSIVRSKRKNQTDQLQLSIIYLDGEEFVSFRRLLNTGYYLLILKQKEKFEYDIFGIKDPDCIELRDLNNHFYKINTNTIISTDELLNVNNNYKKERRIGSSNILLYGVPGSGKSWTIEHEYKHEGTKTERVVFHPDYTYSDFTGQILPGVDSDGHVTYGFVPGPFTKILRDAQKNPDTDYLLIIEEINRGNAPAIFGDVFQLLDRKTEENGDGFPLGTSAYAITNANIAGVVYDGEKEHEVRIPSNLTIIGTMNTSDQNVFTLDTAFQRRWEMRLIENTFDNVDPEFSEMMIMDTGITWRMFCTAMNEIISENGTGLTSIEDKRLGVYFVGREDLKTFTADGKTNRKFAEKVIKYLWDDAFKFNRDTVFRTQKYKTLEEVIRGFLSVQYLARFEIFSDTVLGKFDSTEG